MTKLSETQSILLLAACQRPDRCALPLPPSLRGGAAQKVVGALLARGLLAEAEAAHGAPRLAGDGRWSRRHAGRDRGRAGGAGAGVRHEPRRRLHSPGGAGRVP